MKMILEQLIAGKSLTQSQAREMMESIMTGALTSAQIAALLTALRIKGESIDEITGCAQVMREKAQSIDLNDIELTDTCGTGGDGGTTYNVSTAAAIVLAAAGVSVAKHGNRSVSSKCGSADVLEELGVKVDLSQEDVARCIKETGIGFMFAPVFHKAMKYVMPARRELGIRTIFNMLGPLTNPASASYQVIGVYDKKLTHMFAQVLKRLGTKRALIVHGLDGMDEISLCDKTQACELKEDGSIVDYLIDPRDYGFNICDASMLKGGDCKENAKIITDILHGEKGAKRNLLCINAGAALYISGKADSISEGIKLAKETIDSGAAHEKLLQFIKESHEV